RSIENISAKEKDILRRGALDELIDEYLLRIKTNANLEKFEVSDAEIDAEMERFNKRFPTTEQRDEAITAQGMEGEKELRLRMTAILQQEKYLQHQTQKALSVSDAEAKEWYDAHQSEIALPERRRVRHLFIATLDTPSDEAREKLSAHLAAIKEGKTDIAKLASTVSEDEASKKSGGDLGWMRRARLPGDFAAPVFTVAKGTPTLIRTKLGWHIIEVTEIKPPAPLPFEQCKDEVKASISDQRRALVIKQYRHQLRIVNKERIEVYAEVFGVPDKKPDE
ncbi:MAG: peptidylprolyl isomerase, partial [Akkermansiaceae bacterium]